MAVSLNQFQGIVSGLTKILGITDVGDKDYVSVSSEAISDVEYNISTNSLIIDFNNGGRYLYPNVPESIYEELVNSSSVGRYFVFNIRNGVYGLNYIRL